MKVIAERPPSRFPTESPELTWPRNLSNGGVDLTPIQADITMLQGNVSALQSKNVQQDQRADHVEKLTFLEGVE